MAVIFLVVDVSIKNKYISNQEENRKYKWKNENLNMLGCIKFQKIHKIITSN